MDTENPIDRKHALPILGAGLVKALQKDLMNKLQAKAKSTPTVTKLDLVEWFADAAFTVEVRVRGKPDEPSTLKVIGGSNHDVGVLIHRLNVDKRSSL